MTGDRSAEVVGSNSKYFCLRILNGLLPHSKNTHVSFTLDSKLSKCVEGGGARFSEWLDG